MLGSARKAVTAALNFESDTRELRGAERALKNLDRQLRDVGSSALAFEEANDAANRSLRRTATRSGSASTGLAALQSQMVSTATAAQALREENDDLNDALRNMDDEAADLTLGVLTEQLDDTDIADKIDEVDDLNRAFGDMGDSFAEAIELMDDDQIEQIARLSAGLDADIDQPSDLFGEQVDQMEEALELLEGIDEIDESAGDVFADVLEESGETVELHDVVDFDQDIDPELFEGLEMDGDAQLFRSNFIEEIITSDDQSLIDLLGRSDEDLSRLLGNIGESDYLADTNIKEFRKELVKLLGTVDDESGIGGTLSQLFSTDSEVFDVDPEDYYDKRNDPGPKLDDFIEDSLPSDEIWRGYSERGGYVHGMGRIPVRPPNNFKQASIPEDSEGDFIPFPFPEGREDRNEGTQLDMDDAFATSDITIPSSLFWALRDDAGINSIGDLLAKSDDAIKSAASGAGFDHLDASQIRQHLLGEGAETFLQHGPQTLPENLRLGDIDTDEYPALRGILQGGDSTAIRNALADAGMGTVGDILDADEGDLQDELDSAGVTGLDAAELQKRVRQSALERSDDADRVGKRVGIGEATRDILPDYIGDILSAEDTFLDEDQFESFAGLRNVPSQIIFPENEELLERLGIQDLRDILQLDETTATNLNEAVFGAGEIGSIREITDISDIDDGYSNIAEFDRSMQSLGELMEESDAIGDAIRGADSLEDATERIRRSDPSKLAEFMDWADDNVEAIGMFFDEMGEVTREGIEDGSITDIGELRDEVLDIMRRDTSEGGVGLSNFSAHEAEILSRVGANIDRALLTDPESGGDLPLTQETVGMGLLSEAFQAEEGSSRERDSMKLMQRLMNPDQENLGIRNSILDDPEYVRASMGRTFLSNMPDEFDESIIDEIAMSLAGADTSLFDLMDPEEGMMPADIVSDAFERGDFGNASRAQVHQATRALERSLPAIQEDIATQIAPGANMTGMLADEDGGFPSMFPGGELAGTRMGVDVKPPEYKDRLERYGEDLKESTRELRGRRNQNRLLSGTALQDLPGGRAISEMIFGENAPERRMGLFGAMSRRGSQALSSVGLTDPTYTRKLNRGLVDLRNTYTGLVPLLEATSVNLGAVNVNFESLGILIAKVTAIFGPFLAALGGVVTGALTAATALGSLAATGALDFFEQMEETMIGVENRGEAMQQVMKTVKEMAIEALAPIRNVRIGGDSPADLFVGSIRGALTLLNRFAEVMSIVLQRDSVANALERMHNFIYDRSGDRNFAQQLGESLDAIMPLLMRLVGALIHGFDDFLEFTTYVANRLGGNFLTALSNISDVLGMITVYGAGFITFMIRVAGTLAWVVKELSVFVDALAYAISLFTPFNATGRDLIFTLGGIVGAINILHRSLLLIVGSAGATAKTVAGLIKVLQFYGVTAKVTAAINFALQNSFYATARAAAVLIARLAVMAAAAIVVHDAFAALSGLDPVLFDMGPILGALVALTSIVYIVASWASGLGLVATKMAAISTMISYAGTAASALVTILTASTTWWAIIIVAVASLIEYLLTGESTLAGWLREIEWIDNIFESIEERVERINELLDGTFLGNRGGVVGRSINFMSAASAFSPFIPNPATIGRGVRRARNMVGLDTGGFVRRDGMAMLHSGEQVLSESDVDRHRTGRTGGSGGDITVRINNSGMIGIDDFDRHIEEKLDEFLRKRTRRR